MAKLKNPISIKVFFCLHPLPNSDSLTEGLILNERALETSQKFTYLKADFVTNINIQSNNHYILWVIWWNTQADA